MIERIIWQWRFRNITWRWYFDRHDLWRGIYWKRTTSVVRPAASWLHLYIVPVPCCVIRVQVLVRGMDAP